MMLVSFVSINVNAAELKITDNIVLRDVDDKVIEQGFLSKKQLITLSEGKHSLVLKYKDVFEDIDFAEERLVKSDYFVVKFVVEGQQSLTLSTTKINDLAAAERFAQKPELILLGEDNQEVVLTLQKLSDYELAKQVTQVVTTLSYPADSVQSNTKASKVNKNEQTFNDNVINQVDAVPMLKYWWKKANQVEKTNFLNFIKNNQKDNLKIEN